jgi:phosphoenolpyruvate carboxylase
MRPATPVFSAGAASLRKCSIARMTDAPAPDPARETIAELLLALKEAREAAATDPFGDPVLLIALAISRRLDDGRLDEAMLARIIARLAHEAAAERASRLAAYVGLPGAAGVLPGLAARLVRPDPEDSPVPFAAYRAAVERIRFAAVFTAHPTFSLPRATAAAVAAAATGAALPEGLPHRPDAPSLAEEFDQAVEAITRGRDALDGLTAALLGAARGVWGDRWQALMPRPVVLSSWVGYDTDGRTDIGWWDTLRLRLVMKWRQLSRLIDQLAPLGDCAAALRTRAEEAEAAVVLQIEAAPRTPDPAAVQAFAALLVGRREVALTDAAPLLGMFPAAMAAAPDEGTRVRLAVARAGLASHGLALAHTHVRLNASQLHNAIRQRLGIVDSPDDMARRRGLLGAINAALAEVVPQPVDFGALLAEQASAARLMLTVAQIVKHVDGSQPVRFLIAETETGYTLLSALWLARRLGVERFVEISPLFETAEALERGERVLEEALRSPHWRDYIRLHGRMCLQFGYSDSGRYVGQLPGSYLAERLKLRLADQLRRHGLADIELVLFDTHGESIGRGAHPAGLADRFAYLSPPQARAALARAGFRLREETSFQGGDGYMLFGTPELASATVARIAEHAFAAPGAAPDATPDPIYMEADFGADFFATVRREMAALVEDPGYAALLGAFGPGLLDRTGSRPAARQSDGVGGPARITHPSQLRAIPNNAILHQLGLAGEHAARAWAPRRPPIRMPSRISVRAARALPVPWPWRRARPRAATSACCAPAWTRSTPAPGSTAPAPPSGLGGGRSWSRSRRRWSGSTSRRRCGGCSGGCRRTTWRCAPPGRSCRACRTGWCWCMRCASPCCSGSGCWRRACRNSARATARRGRR